MKKKIQKGVSHIIIYYIIQYRTAQYIPTILYIILYNINNN